MKMLVSQKMRLNPSPPGVGAHRNPDRFRRRSPRRIRPFQKHRRAMCRWGSRRIRFDTSQAKAGIAAEDRLLPEEHTSELQSLTNLVCRLLLEKNIYNAFSSFSGSGCTAATSSPLLQFSA